MTYFRDDHSSTLLLRAIVPMLADTQLPADSSTATPASARCIAKAIC